MDHEEKRKQMERALKGIKKVKPLSERKETARRTRERKAARPQRGRARKNWSEYDEDEPFEGFEKIVRQTEPSTPVARKKPTYAGPHDWLVVGVHAGQLDVCKKSKTRRAHLGGTPLHGGPPVVGDKVAVQELPLGECRVLSIEERTSVLSRKDPGNQHRQKLLAANVDAAVIALPPQEDGQLRVGIVERIRIALQIGNVLPIVVVTKVDRHLGDARAKLDRDLEILRDSGLECHATSALTAEGIQNLSERLEGLTTVIVGHSGVGKSTLLNALDPDHERDTGGVRESDDRGRHTTTSSCMFPMPGGGWLIDTPGIRSFGLSNIAPEELLEYFPRLLAHSLDCPRGCAHQQEDCALRIAAESESDVNRELGSYFRILVDLGNDSGRDC